MSDWTRISWLVIGIALLAISCGGEPSGEPASEVDTGEQARAERGGTFAQLAARSQLRDGEGDQEGVVGTLAVVQGAEGQASGTTAGEILALFPEIDGAPLTELPEGFHASIGEYPGMTIEAVYVDEEMVNLSFTVEQQPDAVLDTLGKRLVEEGWTLSEVVKDQAGDVLTGQKGEEVASFVVMSEEGNTTRVVGTVIP